ncbi:hypothetical protein AZF01_18285 [Martelella sp. AD-3]|nr:hypothetical protein AZF01_18285 [Martelella sp. AD-3]
MPAIIDLDFIADMGRINGHCYRQKILAVQRHRGRSQGKCCLQSDADVPRLRHRTPGLLRYVLSELPQRATDADITDLLSFNFAKTTAT